MAQILAGMGRGKEALREASLAVEWLESESRRDQGDTEIQQALADAYSSMAIATGASRTGRIQSCEWLQKTIAVYDALDAKGALSVATSKTAEKVKKRREQTCEVPPEALSGSADHQEN